MEEVENARVSYLLDDTLDWNVEMVECCFGKIMAQHILEIAMNSGVGTDVPELIKSCFDSSLSAVAYRTKIGEHDYAFGWLYKLKLHPSEKFRWWRLLRNAICSNVWLS